MGDIYNDNSYIDNNPTLHSEDSDFKFSNILEFLDMLTINENKIKILDVGGGAGLIGKMVMNYFLNKGVEVLLDSLDLSIEMLKIQKKNNPKINNLFNCSLEDCKMKNYDLALMIDVIEHIPNKNLAAFSLNKMTSNIIYNIPIEKNLFDIIRNISLLFQYYKKQTQILGHVHFFSFHSALSFLNSHHQIIEKKFMPYCFYIKKSNFIDYIKLRKSFVRRIELNISCWLYIFNKKFSSLIIQGSCYALVKANKEIN